MSKHYAVIEGRNPGVYDNWFECKKQVDGYSSAVFKSYPSKKQAVEAYNAQSINKSKPIDTTVENEASYDPKSLSVDASCLGNPGVTEYQGVVTGTGFKLFDSKVYPKGTNNIGEFLAIVDAIKYLINKGYDYPIYTDSKTAMAWIRNKKIKTSLVKTEETEELFNDIDKAIEFLNNSTYQPDIRKWQTIHWGESKADFGRK